MELDPDEKELLESFGRGEWKPVDAEEIARMRELARSQFHADARAGLDARDGAGWNNDNAESGQHIAERVKRRGRSARLKKT